MEFGSVIGRRERRGTEECTGRTRMVNQIEDYHSMIGVRSTVI